jgi:DNA-binding transcriptional regulator LsrR (DeoR family)
MKLIDLKEYGPIHRFGDHHVYRALSFLSDGRRRGRRSLAEGIGIGEGSIRTILEFLRDKGFVDIKQTGIQITKGGRYFLEGIPIEVKRIPPSDSSLCDKNVAVRIRSSMNMVGSGIQQRDAAIKAGAEGATTILFTNGSLMVPPDYFLDENQPEYASILRRSFELKQGDVVVIGTANEWDDAENGAIAAALDLL